MFRGREITHREIGQAILTRIGNELKEIAIIEQSPRLEGRLLFMILAPNPRWVQQQRALHEKALQQAHKAAPAAKLHAPRAAAAPHAAAPAAPVSQAAPPPAHVEAPTAAPKA
jgi:translation initiation factor IF-3